MVLPSGGFGDSSSSSSAESIITVGVVEEEKDNKMVLHLSVSICKDLLAEIKRAETA